MSPHFGLLDPAKMSRAEAALLRARLHWRGGRRRLREQKTSAAIATLYDAMLSGLRWYILNHSGEERGAPAEEELENDHFIFSRGRRAGVLTAGVDPAWLQTVVGQALQGKDIGPAQDLFVEQVEEVLTQSGVLPFDESNLPPENPATF